jgi:DNA-directed RNA polymerase subunit M/transcription elongation factor TFIIS
LDVACPRVVGQSFTHVREPITLCPLVLFRSEKLNSQMLYDVASDPALARTYDVKCKECGGSEAVYYQSPVGKNDEALVLVFVCVNSSCGAKWLSSDM